MSQDSDHGKSGMDVRYVANLARLELTDAEAREFQGQLARVVEYFRELQELDLVGVDPMAHAVPIQNVFREDVARDGLDREAVLANAPQSTSELFVVPKIVE